MKHYSLAERDNPGQGRRGRKEVRRIDARPDSQANGEVLHERRVLADSSSSRYKGTHSDELIPEYVSQVDPRRSVQGNGAWRPTRGELNGVEFARCGQGSLYSLQRRKKRHVNWSSRVMNAPTYREARLPAEVDDQARYVRSDELSKNVSGAARLCRL